MRSPFLSALLNPLNLSMLALVVAAGLCAAWWWAPIGIVLWVVMVAIIATDPAAQVTNKIDQRQPLAQRYQRAFNLLQRTQVSIFNSVNNGPRPLRNPLQPVVSLSENLIDQAYRLCTRMSVLENHRLVSPSKIDINAQIAEQQRKFDQAEDAMVKREYEESIEALNKRLGSIINLEKQLNRTEAQLSSLNSELNQTLTEIIRIQALDADQAKGFIPQIINSMGKTQKEFMTFESEVGKI